ncbi:MAG: hypothetical protein CW691_07090 [Candidatus Bathyarchaeum sp.]|nr:MAG: hypothetical protein CW691_07090 [Candidatus Bathyarchaeum sp.]
MASNENRQGQLKLRPNFGHLAIGSAIVTVVIFFQVQLISSFDLSALFSIIFFNILFLFLIFPLEGPLRRKVVLLIVGNQVGILWHGIQVLLEDAILFLNTDTFKIMFLVTRPLIDFVWIVAVWSISLSMMTAYKTKAERLEKD